MVHRWIYLNTPPVSATAPSAAGPAGLAGLSMVSIPPQWQPLVTLLNGAFSRLGAYSPADMKKRPAVEKALSAFVAKLAASELSPDVCSLMLQFSQACETNPHEAKEVVRKLTDAHWDQFKAFKDIKFLIK